MEVYEISRFLSKAKVAFIAGLIAVFSINVNAQITDTNNILIPVKKTYLYKFLIPPALSITAGILINNSIGWPFSASDVRRFSQRNIGPVHTEIDNYLQFTPAAAVGGLQMAGIKGKNSLKDEFFLYALSLTCQSMVVFPLKRFTKVERPDGSARNSMPSGHTSAAFAAATFMYLEYKDVSPWYGVAAYTCATSVESLRIIKDRHWLSDALVGAGIGILCTRAVYAIYPLLKKKPIHSRCRIK